MVLQIKGLSIAKTNHHKGHIRDGSGQKFLTRGSGRVIHGPDGSGRVGSGKITPKNFQVGYGSGNLLIYFGSGRIRVGSLLIPPLASD